MRVAFIFTLFKTSPADVKRLENEVKKIGFDDYVTYFIDNTNNNRGYAGGANEGIRKGIKDGSDLFVVANPDISLVGLKAKDVVRGLKRFDILGLTMKQEGRKYYGGELDRWRMSGGLIDKKPAKRYVETDFVSGSLMFVKKSVVEKIGLMDESYFLYYEEVDYCFKAKRIGFKVGIDSLLAYDHFEVSKGNPTKNYYLFKNRLKFLLKYGSTKQKLYELVRSPKTIYEEVIKRPFYVNFFSLNLSSLINKALHFILFLVMIRSFAPAEYAVYTLAWTHIGLLLPLLDFGTTSYGLVYLHAKSKDSSSVLFSFRLVLALLSLILTLSLVFIFRYPPQVVTAIFLTSVVIISNSLSGSFLIFTSVKEKSYLVSLVSMIFQIVLVLVTIAAILLTHQMISVFVIIFILYLIYGLVNFYLAKKHAVNLKFSIDFDSWLKIARKSVMFLAVSLLAGFYSKADVLILNFLKGPHDVGIYSAGYKFLDALMFVVTAYNVSSVPMFARFAREKQKSLFQTKMVKDTVLVGGIGIAAAIAIWTLSPIVLPYLMKGDYSSSIAVLRIIIFALPMILLTSVSLNGLYALDKVKSVIWLFFFQVIYNVTMNFIFIPKYGYFAPSWITILGETINMTISFIILRRAINENFH